MTIYDTMIADAAGRLETALRANSGRQVYVWAIPTTPERDGELVVSLDGDAEERRAQEHRAHVVRPMRAQRWEVVPYSRLYASLWDACRSEPILPVAR